MDQNKFLSAADILSSDDLDIAEVDCPEWGGKVRIRALSAAEAIKYTESVKGPAAKNANALLVLTCAVNEDGSPMFTAQQLAALNAKSLKVINRIATAIIEQNGLGDVKKAKEAEHEVKND